jgi:hypothetical protein
MSIFRSSFNSFAGSCRQTVIVTEAGSVTLVGFAA